MLTFTILILNPSVTARPTPLPHVDRSEANTMLKDTTLFYLAWLQEILAPSEFFTWQCNIE